MVDIIIDAQTNPGDARNSAFKKTIFISPLVGYDFYKDEGNFYVYSKTENGGLTWSAPVTVSVAEATVRKLAVWYDRRTKGDLGTTIHITYFTGVTPGNVVVRYRALDTSDDSLAPERQVAVGGLVSAFNSTWATGGGGNASFVDIVKARGGNIAIWYWTNNTGGSARGFFVSTDGGVTFGAAASPADGDLVDRGFMVPGNEPGSNDIWAFYQDVSADEITLKFQTAAVWSESAVIATVNERFSATWSIAAAPRLSDEATILFVITDMGQNNADGLVFECVNSSTFNALANVFTAEQNHKWTTLSVDHNDVIYAVWLGIGTDTWQSDLGLYSRRSINGGVSWEALSARYNDSVYNDVRSVHVDPGIGNDGGRLEPIWTFVGGGNNPRQEITNFTNSIEVADTSPPPLPPPVEQASGGTFNRLLSGGAGGFMSYITSDGRLIPFHTPHDFGRWTISFSGFGTPPIQYITQRGPFQHGETVKDFFLRPRVLQLLIRQGFANRTRWWAGRAALLDEIRPNRQATATAAVPGQLRIVQTDGTIRDLNVFISEGPRFEPRVSNQWDEFAFQEVLRFIAHDPVAFDPTQIIATVTLGLASDLVFPITFPITFGSGLVDSTLNITYLGTWLELPVITIVGPLEDVRIDNTTTGEKIELSAAIAPGRTVTIDLRQGFKTVVDDLGNNLIGIVTSDSDLATFHLAPDPEAANGVNAIRVRGTNPTGSTSVTIAYFNRYFGF